MKKLLVSTGLKETRLKGYSTVCLGEWCKLYKDRDEWEKILHEVIEYHWKDRIKLKQDHDYLKILYEKYLILLSEQLNEIHSIKEDKEYWRVILGPWLLTYIPVVWDRWENLRVAFELHGNFTTAFSKQKTNKLIPLNYKEFMQMVSNDEWNYNLFQRIMQSEYYATVDFINVNININKNKLNVKTSLKYKLAVFVDLILSKIDSKDKKIFFYRSYFPNKAFIKLNLKLKQIPRYYFNLFKKKYHAKINFKLRNKSLPIDRESSRYELFLSKNILKDMPKCHLELFHDFRKDAFSIPYRPKIIFTANAHFGEELFCHWVAQQKKLGVTYIVSEHGGSLPPSMSSFNHEEDISSYKVIWSNPFHDKHIKLPSNKLTNLNKSVKKGKYCTLVGMEMIRYSYRVQAAPMSSLVLEHFNQTVDFINKLNENIIRDLQIWPYPNKGWDTKKRYIDLFGSDKVSVSKSYNSIHKDSKLLICTYPQTTFAEAMASGVPTVLLLPDFFELDHATTNIVNELKNKNLIFTDINLAAQHINRYWDSIDEWWESPKIRILRKKFNEEVLSIHGNNWLEEWSKYLINQTNHVSI